MTRRSLPHMLVFLLVVCSAAALLHVTLALASHSGYGDSPRATQIVRSYFASFNGVLAGGNGDDLDRVTTGLFAGADASRTALILGAMRDTYPNLHLALGAVSGSDELALAQVTALYDDAHLPAWINGGAAQPFPNSIDSLRIENGAVVERFSSARIGVLAQSLAGNGIDFEIERSARLKVVELMLDPGGSKAPFVAVSGPGFVLPIEGAFEVMGNAALQWVDPSNETSGRLAPRGRTVFADQQVLVIPQGQAVLWPVGNAPVRLLLLAMVPTQPLSSLDGRYADPKAPETFEEMLDRLSTGDPSEQIWFGSIRVVATSPYALPPGRLTMELTRIVVPEGETVRLSPDGAQVIAMLRSANPWSELDPGGMTNTSGSVWILEAVRVCRQGSGNGGPANPA